MSNYLKLKCHKSYKIFTEGKIYRGILDENLLYTTIWIWEYNNFDPSDSYNGVRLMYSGFKVGGESLWPDYRDYFLCHKTTERLDKLNKLGL